MTLFSKSHCHCQNYYHNRRYRHKQCHRDPSVQPEPQVKWEGLAGLTQMLPDQVLKVLRPESSVEMRARTKIVEFIGATASTYAVPRN